MKKRILSVILAVLTTVVFYVPTVVAETGKWNGWTKLTSDSLSTYTSDDMIYLPSGKYYLGEDIVLNNKCFRIYTSGNTGVNITFDLNGYCISTNQDSRYAIFGVRYGSVFTLKDSSVGNAGNIVKYHTSRILYTDDGTTFNINGGTINGRVDFENGSTVTNTDSLNQTVFKGVVRNYFNTIDGGIYDNATATLGEDEYNTVNYGTIKRGTFYGNVHNYGKISGGIFYNEIVNKDSGKTDENANVITFINEDDFYAKEVLTGTAVSYEPDTPKKEGYTLLGWYNGDKKFKFGSAITSDITLTAKWIENSELDKINLPETGKANTEKPKTDKPIKVTKSKTSPKTGVNLPVVIWTLATVLCGGTVVGGKIITKKLKHLAK